jgi:general secretion pathway protein G
MSHQDKQHGFTLIEILVVVFIIGILAALIVPNIMGRPDEARVIAARNDVRTLTGALKLYYLDNGRFPSTEQGLRALVAKPERDPVPRNWKTGGYIEQLPVDPWGQPYQYINPGIHGEIDVFSLGADNRPGGDGRNADVGNWEAAPSS